MFALLSPFWLAGFAALLIPLAIHFWNRLDGQRTKIGSIRFLNPHEQRRRSRIQFENLPLFITRIFLLSALAILLAQPVYRPGDLSPASRQSIAFISPALLGNPDSVASQLLDSLAGANVEVRLFVPGFEHNTPEAADRWQNSRPNYWPLLAELARLDAGQRDHMAISYGGMENLSGSRPQLLRPLQWRHFNRNDTCSWIDRARSFGSDSILVVIGRTSRAGIEYLRLRRSVTARGMVEDIDGSLRLSIQRDKQAGQFHLQLLSASEPAAEAFDERSIPLSPPPIKVLALFSDSRRQDLNYVRAASEAAAVYAALPLEFTSQKIGDGQIETGGKRWIFWLADQPPEPTLLARLLPGQLLISDGLGRIPEQVDSSVETELGHPVTLKIRQLLASDSSSTGTAVWSAANGRTVLSARRLPAGATHYEYAGRFHPRWSEWVLSESFPAWLLSLFEPDPDDPRPDYRAIGKHQQTPQITADSSIPAAQGRSQPLSHYFWILAAGLLILERRMAGRKEEAADER